MGMVDFLAWWAMLFALALLLTTPRGVSVVWREPFTWRRRVAWWITAGLVGVALVAAGLPDMFATGLLATLGAARLFGRTIPRSLPARDGPGNSARTQ